MTENETPIKLCKQWAQKLPGCFEKMSEIQSKTKTSEWCDTPISVAMDILNGSMNMFYSSAYGSELTGLYIWRKHKIIYDFDETLAAELTAQAEKSSTQDIPMDVLLHPPVPCVYVRSELIEESTDGAFVWIESDTTTGRLELRVQTVFKNMQHTMPYILDLTKPTISECIADTISAAAKNAPELNSILGDKKTIDLMYAPMLRTLQLYLYVCSDKADIQNNAEQQKIYRPRKSGQTIKDRFRELEIKDVGIVIGSALRHARQAEQYEQENESVDTYKRGSHKRSHTRRGHWHHYWTGSKSEPEQRKLILKWTHPVLVGGYTDNVVTMIPVKE